VRIIDLTLNTITREHLFKYLFIETLPRKWKSAATGSVQQ